VNQIVTTTNDPDHSKTWTSLVILTLFTLLTFVNSWPDALVFDDRIFFGPESDQRLENFAEAFSRDLWSGKNGPSGLYRPLLLIDFELQNRLFGAWQEGYHLVNILFHLVTSLTLFGFLRYLLRATQPDNKSHDLYALLAALVFAVHPVHAEVVNSVFNKSSMYISLAAIAGLWWLLANLEQRPARAWIGFGLVYCAAILCKESALVLPGIAVAMIVLLTEGGLKLRIRRFLPVFWLLVPLAVYFWIRGMVLASADGQTVIASDELLSMFSSAESFSYRSPLTGFALFGQGLKLLAWPYPLRMYYGLPAGTALVAYIGIQALLVGWATYLLAKGRPMLAFALVFYYLAFLPSTRLTGFSGATFPLAERYLYFPSVGMTLALAFGLRALATRLGRKYLAMIMLPVLLTLAAISWDRNADWMSEAQLFETEYQSGSRDMTFMRNLIATHYNNDRFQRVKEICDENSSEFTQSLGFADACANTYVRTGHIDEAVAALLTHAREGDKGKDRIAARLKLVSIYLALKQFKEVASQYMAIIDQVEEPAGKALYKGELLLSIYPESREQLENARRLFQQAIELDPNLRVARKRIKQIDKKLAGTD